MSRFVIGVLLLVFGLLILGGIISVWLTHREKRYIRQEELEHERRQTEMERLFDE